MANEVLEGMRADFNELYSRTRRLSIRSERLLLARLLQPLYAARSERLPMEQLNCNQWSRFGRGKRAILDADKS